MPPIRLRTYQISWDVHSTTGILTGLFLFVFFFAGAFALYLDDLRLWERPGDRIAYHGPPSSVDALLSPVLDGHDVRGETVRVTLPSPQQPALHVTWDEGDPVRLNPTTGAVLGAPQNSYAGDLLYELHCFEWLPAYAGLGFTGWIALLGGIAITTGLVVHLNGLQREIFQFRPWKVGRVRWADAHKVLGTFGLPFGLALTFTGALIGLGHMFYYLVLPVGMDGNPDLFDANLRPPPAQVQTGGDGVYPPRVDAYVAAARSAWPQATVYDVEITQAGTAASTVTVRANDPRVLVGGAGSEGYGEIRFHAATGQEIDRVSPTEPYTSVSTLWQVMVGVHYGLYGGWLLKALYFLLAMAFCVTVFSGIVLWLATRRRRFPERLAWYRRLEGFSYGVMVGLLPATAFLLLATKAIPMDVAGRTLWEGTVFYGAWLTGTIYACASRTPVRAATHLLVAGGCLALLIPIANGLATGDWPWVALRRGVAPVFWVDVAAFAFGVGLLAAGRSPSLPSPHTDAPAPFETYAPLTESGDAVESLPPQSTADSSRVSKPDRTS